MNNLVKGEKISETLDDLISKKDFKTIESAIETMAQNEQNIIQTKKLLDTIIEKLSKISNNDLIEFGKNVLSKLQNRLYLELQIAKIKEALADVFAAKEDYYAASEILSQINFESQNLNYTPAQKLTNYIKIAEFYFESDDATSAESYVKKSSNLVDKVDDRELHLRFEVCFARSLDAARKFIQAASKYHWLSLQTGIDEENLAYLLDCSIICSMLSPAGPQRSRILASLYKDERTSRSKHFDIFYKMYLDRIITKKEKDNFSQTLKKHQRSSIEPDFTVVDKAIMEHNIIAISKLYDTITFDSMSKMLGYSNYQCEKTIHAMISEKRVKATIDQIQGFIDFTLEFDEYNRWTEGINNFCTGLDKFITKIAPH